MIQPLPEAADAPLMSDLAFQAAEEIASQASSLYDHWRTMQPEAKREIVEIITDKIIVGKDEITINLTYSPSCKDMANRWRKGWDSNPR